MKLVLVPDPRSGFAVGTEENAGEVDEGEEGILFAKGLNLSIKILIDRPFAHAFWGGFAREVNEGSMGKNLADPDYEGGEFVERFYD